MAKSIIKFIGTVAIIGGILVLTSPPVDKLRQQLDEDINNTINNKLSKEIDQTNPFSVFAGVAVNTIVSAISKPVTCLVPIHTTDCTFLKLLKLEVEEQIIHYT